MQFVSQKYCNMETKPCKLENVKNMSGFYGYPIVASISILADRMPTEKVSEGGKTGLAKTGLMEMLGAKTHQVLSIKRSLAILR